MSVPRRRYLLGALAGSAVMLTGCAVPGQPVAANIAAERGDMVLTNQEVDALADAWTFATDREISRREIISLELLREPLAAATDQIGFDYTRSDARLYAEMLMEEKGETGEPSEELIDVMEGSLLVAAFTVLPTDLSAITAVAQDVEADAVTDTRAGSFEADGYIELLSQVATIATNAASAGETYWFLLFAGAPGLYDEDVAWIASE
ncbi:hypothetical protein [Demequina sp.]|uniref:hypothetical protein n=1 Tax=Demequina sp. TaxID=2050685 RepID=UPI003A85BAD6